MEKKKSIIEEANILEQKALDAKEKLSKLKEKISKNPPKSVGASNRMNRKLKDLDIMLNTAISKANATTLYISATYNEYDKYKEAQEILGESLDALEEKREDLSSEISKLDRKESKVAKRQQRIESYMPEGYTSKSTRTDNKEGRTTRRQELEEELRGIEQKIARVEETLNVNDTKYSKMIGDMAEKHEQDLEEIEQKYNQDLAISKPGLFKRIRNWWQERKNRAAEMLDNTMKKTEESSQREIFLQENAGNISLREQADRIAKNQWKIIDNRGYETTQMAGENPNKARKIEGLPRSQEDLEPEETGTEIR